MKLLTVLILVFSNVLFAQEINTKPPYASEGSPAVPKVIHEKKSEVVETVDEAAAVPEANLETKIENKTEVVEKKSLKTKDLRAESTGTLMIGYQLFTTWLPSKKTLSYTHIFNDKWSLDFEYAWASIEAPIYGVDLGEIKEKRYTLQARRYVGNSFNFSFGPVLNEFRARLGSDILDTFGAEIKSSFEVQNLGISGGMGNRWQWSNGITFGIDWFRINIPVVETNIEDNVLDDIPNAGDRDDVKTVIRTLNRIPTFVLLGINLGYTF